MYLSFSFNFFSLQSPKNTNICTSQFDGTILPHATDCQKFYICVNENPQEYNCGGNFHFDAISHSCVAGADCSTAARPLPPSCVEGTTRPVEDNCYIFEICVNGQYQKINCPAKYYFNAPQGFCVPLQYDAQFKCNCVLPEHSVMANDNNCETYFVCKGKTSVLENCPLGQYYNPAINTCITDLNGVCLMKPTLPSFIKDEEVKVEVNAIDLKAECTQLGLKDIHFQTFAYGCNKFAVCVNGRLYTQHCPKGFYYDGDKKYCLVDLVNRCTDNEEQKVNQ